MIEIMPDPWPDPEWYRELNDDDPAPRHLPRAGWQHPARKETA